ncbi:ribonuclease H-like protein [Aspergillus sclerotioniger CBS 115572]|uniref:Ribonuclease H-like protein n=1 Tax=Aspergillus sclerotioniger CBS 115572 TaxID=1450535 RepID=A0A317X5T9_9EURO|nr:ribonuclease H-like protein [Aspergillus sclerotioniger CBS 115572]PWY93685.1 ribonuclease H-like protein [Aspergillus sclerotioniger CBS 115572]
MRLTTPTLKAITPTKPTTNNTSIKASYPWLQILKATTLQHLAQKTGIKSSGPKALLIQRLEGELPRCEYLHHGSGSGSGSTRKNPKARELRILSIDMGIRNLAFACLSVPPDPASLSGGDNLGKNYEGGGGTGNQIVLEAWRRLSIPRIREEFNLPVSMSMSESLAKTGIRLIASEEEHTTTTDTGDSITSPAATKEDFSPAVYAHHAYSLITTLLDLYKPTHILIERQRFRSGGGSAVQEWTIRVGVFEGMLYAVLRTLRVAVGGEGGLVGGEVEVWGMEPGRVSRFWGEEGDQSNAGDGDGDGKKKRKSVRDVKKMKIGLVGGWLGEESGRVVVGEDGEVRKWVDAFLEKYQGKRSKKGDGKVEIGKLDDLADCLVQGVTWLEWQRMRQKVVLAEGRIE